VTYSELTPSSVLEVIDPDLKDATGYNADIGFRGKIKQYIHFDLGLFYLHYNNRIGTIPQNGTPYRTNIGASLSKGFEGYAELDPFGWWLSNNRWGQIKCFASLSFLDARYIRWDRPDLVNNPSKTLVNNSVENAPGSVQRYGITYRVQHFSLTYQWNQVSEVYTDAANTVLPNISGTVGKLPGYQVSDVSLNYSWLERYTIKGGVNNLTDVHYATRRATGYPGPGLLPANGRTIYICFGVKL
jgi:Fe(3+) dicitrate transport protein